MLIPDDGVAPPALHLPLQVPADNPIAPAPQPVAKAGTLNATLLTTVAQLDAIAPAWNDLWTRASAPHPTLCREWVMTAWRHIAEPEGARLSVVAVHDNERVSRGRLLALWPVVTSSYHRLWRRARQLCASWDYSDILLDRDQDPTALVDIAWRALTRASGADLITIQLARAGSPLYRLLMTNRATVTDQTTIHAIDWNGIADWRSYYRNISDSAGWARRERRLREQGEVTLGPELAPGKAADAVRWMLAQKRVWLERKAKFSDWLHLPGYENFLLESVEGMPEAASMPVFTLSLDGQLIAVQVCLVDNHRMLCHHTAFDPAFARFSPGILVTKFALNWAFDRHLPVDFGYGTESCKAAFANNLYEVADFTFVNTAWGQWHQVLKRAKGSDRASRNPGFLRMTRSWLRASAARRNSITAK
jgi:CelD/BcsL family acetyltransferase involved in cellulose biosynthesis